MKIYFAILCAIILFCLSVCAQKISFAYDEAGNRISRELVIVKSMRPSSLASASYYDLLDDASIKITQANNGRIVIEITNYSESMFGQISLYSINGIVLFSEGIRHDQIIVDLSGQPNGIYILGIEVNGQQLSWKIINK